MDILISEDLAQPLFLMGQTQSSRPIFTEHTSNPTVHDTRAVARCGGYGRSTRRRSVVPTRSHRAPSGGGHGGERALRDRRYVSSAVEDRGSACHIVAS